MHKIADSSESADLETVKIIFDKVSIDNLKIKRLGSKDVNKTRPIRTTLNGKQEVINGILSWFRIFKYVLKSNIEKIDQLNTISHLFKNQETQFDQKRD